MGFFDEYILQSDYDKLSPVDLLAEKRIPISSDAFAIGDTIQKLIDVLNELRKRIK